MPCLARIDLYYAAMPYRQYPGSPVQNWWDTELSPLIMNGGGYTFLTTVCPFLFLRASLLILIFAEGPLYS